MGEECATIRSLEALLAVSRSEPEREDAADGLCRLLGSSFGGTPRHSVSRVGMPRATAIIAETVSLLGPARVDVAARHHELPVALRHWLLGLGLPGSGVEYAPADGGGLDVLMAGTKVSSLDELTVNLAVTRFADGDLTIDACASPTALFALPLTFEIEIAGVTYPAETTGEYAGFALFGHRFIDGVHLRVVCRGLRGIGRGEIAFRAVAESDGDPYSVRTRLTYGPYSHLPRGPHRYWSVGGLRFTARARSVLFITRSGLRSLLDEVRLVRHLLTSKDPDDRRVAVTRVAYRVTRWYYRRNPVWLAHDKMYSAGDCGEYMYRYLEDHRKGVVPYYAINADAPEVAALRDRGSRLVHPGTLRHRLIYLHAQVLFTTHGNPAAYNALGGNAGAGYRDLLSARIVCIQHGLTMQDIAGFMHRSHVGIERYYCASQHEIANLEQPEYGYSSDQLALTGIPRYDGLHSAPERRVLLAPTWRPEFAGAATALNTRRPVSPDFLDTPFFRLYTRVLTDPRLLACAAETGYTMDFVLHPYLAANADVLSRHLARETSAQGPFGARVRVVVTGVEAPYETLLEQADLMVTDFSGVQYDFAYMGKPVVYFHPDEIPSHYGHGAMDYANMGFGEITTTAEGLVEVLSDYMRRDCAIADVYRARIEAFFEYRDDQNCARILADLKDHLNRSESR